MSTIRSSNQPSFYPEVLRLVLEILSDIPTPKNGAVQARVSTRPSRKNQPFLTRWTHLPPVSIMKVRAHASFGLGEIELFFDGGPSNPKVGVGRYPVCRYGGACRFRHWIVSKFRGGADDDQLSASELLSNFRDLFDQGKLSDQEFRNIKTLLKDQLDKELSSSGQRDYENQNRNAAQQDDKGSTDGAAPNEDWDEEE